MPEPPEPSQRRSVFISYSHQDEAIALRVRDTLVSQDFPVWIDQTGIRPGTPNWQAAIRQAVRQSQVIVLLASPNSQESDYVQDELELARAFQRPVYPLWVLGNVWMEAIPLGWGQTQWIDAREEREQEGLRQLIAALSGEASSLATIPPVRGGTGVAWASFPIDSVESELVSRHEPTDNNGWSIESAQPGRRKSLLTMKLIAAVLTLVILLAAGGSTVAYVLTRSMPSIKVTSIYHVGLTPAGASGTNLHVIGQKFASNSAVTFLLDGHPAPDTPISKSDSSGTIIADIKVTNKWSIRGHTITAKDANGNITHAGIPIQIVCLGCANTPGPNGAPSNSAFFTLNITITSKNFGLIKETLIIASEGDSGNSVCQSRDDGKTPFKESGTIGFDDGTHFFYTESSTSRCSGIYASGFLTYTEMTVIDEFDVSGYLGIVQHCPSDPHKKQVLTGDFTDSNTITGIYKSDGFTLKTCQERLGSDPIYVKGDSGTWSGVIV